MLIAELTFNGEDAHHSEVSNPPPTIISFDTFAGGYDLNVIATDMERKHTPEEDPSQSGRVVLCLRNVIFGAETLRPGFRLKCDISEWS
jgi:hypothetical protein